MLQTLRQKLQAGGDLGTLPFVVQNLLSLMADPTASARDLKRVIQADQALVARVLKLANSAYYGFAHKISDVGQAVTLIGFGALRRMVMSITAFDMFFRSGNEVYDRNTLWYHSLSTACCARLLASRLGAASSEEMFAAGLLHDVGLALLDQHVHACFVSLMRTAREQGRSLIDVERSALGVTHEEVGMWAANAWNLPPVLSFAIRNHHSPFEAGPYIVPATVVGLADMLCDDPFMTIDDKDRLIPPLATYLRLSAADQEKVMRETAEEVGRVTEFLNLQDDGRRRAGQSLD